MLFLSGNFHTFIALQNKGVSQRCLFHSAQNMNMFGNSKEELRWQIEFRLLIRWPYARKAFLGYPGRHNHATTRVLKSEREEEQQVRWCHVRRTHSHLLLLVLQMGDCRSPVEARKLYGSRFSSKTSTKCGPADIWCQPSESQSVLNLQSYRTIKLW